MSENTNNTFTVATLKAAVKAFGYNFRQPSNKNTNNKDAYSNISFPEGSKVVETILNNWKINSIMIQLADGRFEVGTAQSLKFVSQGTFETREEATRYSVAIIAGKHFDSLAEFVQAAK